MVCKNCGKVIDNDSKFCIYCGESVSSQHESKSRFKMVALGLGAVAVVAAIVILLSSFFGGARNKIIKAAENTLNEYSEVLDVFGMRTLKELSEKQAYTTTIGIDVEAASENMEYYNGIAAGTGAHFVVAADLPNHKLSLSSALRMGSADLLNLYLDMNEGQVTVFSPEVLNDTALAINTETLGKDMSNAEWVDPTLYDGMEDFESFGFNIFDLCDLILDVEPMDENISQDFTDAIEVEKNGTEELEINGNDIKCTIYDVVIPNEAVLEYLEAVIEYANDSAKTTAIFDYFESLGIDLGLDGDDIAESMESAYSEEIETLVTAIEEYGDIEFQVAVKNNRIMAVEGEVEIDGELIEYILQLGGGEAYADDFSLIIKSKNTISIKSTGNHTCRNGVFTDVTTISAEFDGIEKSISFETEYNTKTKEDNFSFEIHFFDENEKFAVNGTLSIDDGISLLFDELIFDDGYGESLTLSGECSVSPYEKVVIPADKTSDLFNMSEDDIAELMEILGGNVSSLIGNFLGY